jgi:hypothetical protein
MLEKLTNGIVESVLLGAKHVDYGVQGSKQLSAHRGL